MYKTYWINHGREFESIQNAEQFEKWLEWAKKYSKAYGWEKIG